MTNNKVLVGLGIGTAAAFCIAWLGYGVLGTLALVLAAAISILAYLREVKRAVLVKVERLESQRLAHLASDAQAAAWLVRRFDYVDIPVTGSSMRAMNLMALVCHVEAVQPQRILEFGCGLSTLVLAAVIRDIGCGKIVSVESDKGWADLLRSYLRKHGLDQYVDLRVVPVSKVELPDGKKAS